MSPLILIQHSTSKKIAIVGSGCSGLAALWALKSTDHEVYLYEADSRLGGHTNTVKWTAGKYSVDVDTGFIVLNTATYPNFIHFLKHVGVATEHTDMSLGVSRDRGAFEWAGRSLTSVFCQTRNIFSIRMWRMLFDVVRFNQFALDVIINANDDGEPGEHENVESVNATETIGEYLSRNGYSDAFRDWYLIPITAAVWSTSPNKCIDEFPILTLVRFLWNHHNLSTISARPEWLTLSQGSRSYIDAILKDFPSQRIFLDSPVSTLKNDSNGRVLLELENGRTELFDHVVLATHGDQALSILGNSATKRERATLSCFKTSRNEAVLHSDLTHMPKRRSAWTSWNYLTLSPQSKGYTDTVSLTYYMNDLQHIPEETFGHVLVTLNPLHQPDPASTQDRFSYAHPLYTEDAIRAQRQLPSIQNTRGISFVGAWTKYGFHEDGFTSGLLAAQDHLGAKIPFPVVDSMYSRGKKPQLGIGDMLARLIITLIQALVIESLELLLGIDRRSLAGTPSKSVKCR